MAQKGTNALKSCDLSEFLSFKDCIPHLINYSYVHTFFPYSISREGSVRAFINNIYENTNLTQESVDKAIENTIKNSNDSFLNGANFTSKYCLNTIQDLTCMSYKPHYFKKLFLIQLCYIWSVLGLTVCEQVPFPCEEKSTICTSRQGRSLCTCKKGYFDTVYSNFSCQGKTTGVRYFFLPVKKRPALI